MAHVKEIEMRITIGVVALIVGLTGCDTGDRWPDCT